MSRDTYCTFTVCDYLFGVPVYEVQEIVRNLERTRVPLAPEAIDGLINLRGQIVPAIDVRHRLALPPRPEDIEPMNVIVKAGGEPVSLLVDEIGDVIEVDAAKFEEPPDTLLETGRDLIHGVMKLDSELMLLLNIDKCVCVTEATRSESR